jgi:phosphopantothenoylcysteine decarboxylase/phosphopantothenate--cysteine ligase
MNPRMWSHAATRANAKTLLERGVIFVGPDEGETAEGELGVGRMAEPEEIFAQVEEALGRTGPLRGKRVVVSAGGTREPIDAVRFVGNRSSGRMGAAIAAEAAKRGAAVTLLAANLSVPAPSGVEVVQTPTAADVEREALARSDADVIVMTAAVADYRPAAPDEAKRPKSSEPWQVELEATTDVLAALGSARRPGQVLVGFAADGAGQGLARAMEKRARKGADLIVFNDVSRPDIGFDASENEVVLLTDEGQQPVAKAPKREIAIAVLDAVERLLSTR